MVTTKHCCFGLCRSDTRYGDREHMKGVFFIPFPKPRRHLEKCQRWIQACKREGFTVDNVTKHTYICSLHFVGGKGPTAEHPDPVQAIRSCCVFGCDAKSHDHLGIKLENGLSFYGFPIWKRCQGAHVSEVTKRRRQAWIAAVKRPGVRFGYTCKYQQVCSRHFHSGKPAYEMDETNPDWAPSLEMGLSNSPTLSAAKSDHRKRRPQRKKQRAKVRGFQDGAAKYECDVTAKVGNEELTEMHISGDQTDPEPKAKRQKMECEFCERSRAETNQLLEENRKLRSEMNKRELNEEFLKNDREKVRYYTGLPCFAILLCLFNNIKCFLPSAKTLSPFQMLLLTLMRLRLNLPLQHLCHLFNVSHQTLSSAFVDTIDVLHAHLGPLVHWPERHFLQATMPPLFIETFGKRVAIIVDCFEIHTERPSNLKAHTQSYSHYKGMHTMKYLVGITPQGSVSFISSGWGGRTSDKRITEKCGLLSKLLPGDIVLANRGFDVRDDVGLMCAEVKTPSFSKDLCKLDTKDVEDTRAVAHLKIHVERVTGTLRDKYKILHTAIPVPLLLPCEGEEMTLLDKIVNVCCVLVNMCPSVAGETGENLTCC